MLTKGAASLVHLVELQTGTLPDNVVKKLEQSEQTEPTKKYDLNEVQQMLINALPDQCDLIKQIAKDACRAQNEKPGDEVGVSILEARTKTVNKLAKVPQPPPPVRVDPYEVVFEMPKNTAFVLFFNGRKVDEEGRPAIMGIAAREGNDSAKLDQSYFFVPEGHQVQTQEVKKSAEFAKFKEENDSEFRAGDPVIAVALDKNGNFISAETMIRPLNEVVNEYYPGLNQGGKWVPDLTKPMLARTVTTGETLDQERVIHYMNRMALDIRAKSGYSPPAFWQEAVPPDVTANLMLKRGFIFEAGAYATTNFNGTMLTTKVEGKDTEVAALPVRLPGSPTKSTALPLTGNFMQLMRQQVMLTTGTNPQAPDVNQLPIHFEDLVMPYLAGATMAGQTLGSAKNGTLMQDIQINNASDTAKHKLFVVRRPASQEMQAHVKSPKAQTAQINLEPGFLEIPGRDLKGLQIEVGYHDNKTWTKFERRKLEGGNSTEKLSFDIGIPDPAALEKAGGRLEIRIYTPEGLPLKKTNIAFNQTLQWANDVFA